MESRVGSVAAAMDSIRPADRFPAVVVVARRFGVVLQMSRQQVVVVARAVDRVELTAKAVWVAVLLEALEETEARPWALVERSLRVVRVARQAVVREPNIKAATVRLEAMTTQVVAVAVGMVVAVVVTTLGVHTAARVVAALRMLPF